MGKKARKRHKEVKKAVRADREKRLATTSVKHTAFRDMLSPEQNVQVSELRAKLERELAEIENGKLQPPPPPMRHDYKITPGQAKENPEEMWLRVECNNCAFFLLAQYKDYKEKIDAASYLCMLPFGTRAEADEQIGKWEQAVAKAYKELQGEQIGLVAIDESQQLALPSASMFEQRPATWKIWGKTGIEEVFKHSCPDGGACHSHPGCGDNYCFRVRACGPLSDVFPGDRWPDDIVKRMSTKPDGDVITVQRQAAGGEPVTHVIEPVDDNHRT